MLRVGKHLSVQIRAAADLADSLLERDDDLAKLGMALDAARGGAGSTVLIAGEAGAGKTTLVRAFSSSVGTRARVLIGACDPLSTPRPLGPFHDLEGPIGVLHDVVTGGASPSDVYGALRTILAEQPTVLVLDDLHWADGASLDVLRLLARRVETLPTLLIGTYRDDELRRDHPMRTLVGDLATTHTLSRIYLAPLTRTAVATLAAGRDIDPGALHTRTGGNPFFVTEVLAGDGRDVPPNIRDAVLARSALLPAEATELLELASIVTPRADSWLIDSILGEHSAALEACLETGLVTVDRHGVRYRHELARLVIERELLPQRRMSLHREVLAALGSHPGGTTDAAELAHHAEAAFDAGAVHVHATRAARQAADSGAYREAAAQYQRALRFASRLTDGDRAELLEGRSRACYLADDQVEAIEEIRRAIACRRRQGAATEEARALIELAGYLSCRGLRAESADAVERSTALVLGEPECATHAYVEEFRARMQLSSTTAATAIELAERAISLGERFHDEYITEYARVTIGSATMMTDFERGAAHLEASICRADDRGLHEVAARALNAIGARSMWAGRRELASVHLERAITYCADHLEDLWRINAVALAARNALDRGLWDDAVEHSSVVLQDPRDSPWPHHEALLVVALARTRRGDPGAVAAADQAATVGVPIEEVGAHVDLAAARAEIAWTERRFADLDRVTGDALVEARRRGDDEAIGRLSFWRRLGGIDAGRADEFDVTDLPYERALSRLLAGEEDGLRCSLDEFRELGALPASRVAARALRGLGARGIDRGPRPATRQHPGGLTAREHQVLDLLAEGLRNAEIAERLVISRRTVDHHVAAILRKLDANTRGQAVARIAELAVN